MSFLALHKAFFEQARRSHLAHSYVAIISNRSRLRFLHLPFFFFCLQSVFIVFVFDSMGTKAIPNLLCSQATIGSESRFQFQPIEMRPLFKTKSRRFLLESWKSRFRYHGTQGANKLADYIAWLAGGSPKRNGLSLACCGWVVFFIVETDSTPIDQS